MLCLALPVVLATASGAQAGTATIGGSIWSGSVDWRGPVLDPDPSQAIGVDAGARVMIQQMEHGEFVGYPSINGNSWSAEVPTPDEAGAVAEYIVMYSAPGFDLTSRAFRVSAGEQLSQDAFLAPLPLPKANLLVYAFEDLYVNGEDDYPDDRGLEGVTFEVIDEDSNVVATGVSGSQLPGEMPFGAGPDMAGLYYFTGLEPGAYKVRAIPPSPRMGSDGWLHTTSEEGSQIWEVVLRPGDPGTEAGVYLIWYGFVERLPASTGYDGPGTGTIRGTLLDADGNDPDEPFPTGLPCVTPNGRVPNGFAVLYNDMSHPYIAATTLADPVTGEFTFSDVPPGVYTIYTCDVPIDYVWSPQQVSLQPGADLSYDILLPRFFARVQGQVLDIDNNPVAGARVIFRLKPGTVWKETVTDANGHYLFESLEEVETMGYVEVEPPAGMRALNAPADDGEADLCRATKGKRGNRYVMFYAGVNYQADLYVEPLPAATGDVTGFAFYDSLQSPDWQSDGQWEQDKEPTLKGVVLNLRDALTNEVVATTTTGEFDKADVLAQGWIPLFSTVPPDEFGGVFSGPILGAYEFRDVTPGDYLLEIVAPAGYEMAPGNSATFPLTVAAASAERVDFGLTTQVPLAGIIEGGVFDDLYLDTNPLSTFYEEKAIITGAPVTVTDHLGYVLDSFIQPSPLCYPSAPAGLCDREDLGDEVEIERRVAPGPRVYVGNDPGHPDFNPNYLPMALNYEMGQGTAKYEADWSLIPAAFAELGGPMFPDGLIIPSNHPAISASTQPLQATPGTPLVISGTNFGSSGGDGTVTLSGEALTVNSWSDTEIEVQIPPQALSGPLLIANSTGPSNALEVEVDYSGNLALASYFEARSVYVDASNTGPQSGTEQEPWQSIGAALENLPAAKPRYVFVAPGTYNENVHITESDVRIIGAGPLETVVDGSGTPGPSQQGVVGPGPVFWIGGDPFGGEVANILISGFTITRAAADGEVGAGIFGGHNNRRIDINNNVIVRNGGCYGGGIWFHYSVHDVDIWSNVIAENGNFCGYGGGISVNDEPDDGLGAEEEDTFYATPPGRYRIFNNLIFQNHSLDYGGGISLYHVQDSIEIYGNLLLENKSDDSGGGAYFGHTGPMSIHGNVFLRNYCADDGGGIAFEDTYDDRLREKQLDVFNNLFVQNIADDRGENHARGGAIAFDDAFLGRVFNNTIVGNIVSGSYTPAGGGIDSERNSEDFDGSEGLYIAPGYSDPRIFNNIIWGNWRLNYDQQIHGEEEDLDYTWGINYRWTPDELHVDNPALQGDWESYKNSQSFSFVRYNNIRGGYPGEGNVDMDPGFLDPSGYDWHLRPDSPMIDRASEVVDAAEGHVAPSDDLDNLPRLASQGKVDIGAFEYRGENPNALRIPTGILGAIQVPSLGTIALGCDPGCEDDNACTTDICNPGTGCIHLNNADPCNDNDECTTSDTCSGGSCSGGPALQCDDGTPCTDDACDSATGCSYANNTAACDDGDACTVDDICRQGSCVGVSRDCCDGNPCTTDSCDPSSGCIHDNNTAYCDDGDACTVGDKCAEGVCAGLPRDCCDGNDCTTDACDSTLGCTYNPIAGSCDDGDLCTFADQCTQGSCVGVPLDCNDGEFCTRDSCDPSLGCTHYAISTACDDDDACTVDDVCVGGLCNGSAIDCSGLDNACEVGLCDSDAGSCVVQPTIDCSFLDDLGVAGVCNPASGACEAQSCASLELLPHSELPIAGGSLVVDLVIDVGESSLGAHSFDLSWTPSELELSGVTHGDSSEFASDPICNIDTAGGHASCAAYQIGSMTGPTGRVHVATFNLTAVSDADSTTLTVEADELASPGLYSLLPCDNPRTLELRGAAGDVNGDGHVNIVDALFAAQYTVNMRGCASFPRYHMCDINPSTPDGRCGIADALWMAQCGVGLIPCGFDCGVLSCDAPQGAAMRIDAASDQVPSRARLHAQEPPTLPAPGELFTSEIFIDTDAALGAYDLSFDCDPAVLEVAAPVRGGGAEEFSTPPIQKVSGCHGELSGFQVTNMAGPSGSISVAEVDLRVLDHNASAGSNPIRVRPKVLVDTTGQPIETYVDPCLDDTSKTGTIRSAMVRAVSTKGTPGGALSVRALLPLTELSKLSSAGGLKFSLLDAAELSLYSAQVPASTFAKAGGKRNRYRFRNADRTATNGLLEFSLRLAPKKGIARLKARAAVAKIDAVMGEPTLTLQLLLGNDAAGNCLRGPDLQCKGKARRLRCR